MAWPIARCYQVRRFYFGMAFSSEHHADDENTAEEEHENVILDQLLNAIHGKQDKKRTFESDQDTIEESSCNKRGCTIQPRQSAREAAAILQYERVDDVSEHMGANVTRFGIQCCVDAPAMNVDTSVQGLVELVSCNTEVKRCKAPSGKIHLSKKNGKYGAVRVLNTETNKCQSFERNATVEDRRITQRIVCKQHTVLEKHTSRIIDKSKQIEIKCVVHDKYTIHHEVNVNNLKLYGKPTFARERIPDVQRQEVDTLIKVDNATEWIKLSHGGRCQECYPHEITFDNARSCWQPLYGRDGQRTGVYYKKTSDELANEMVKLDLKFASLGNVFQNKTSDSEYRFNAILPEAQIAQLEIPLDEFAKDLPGTVTAHLVTAELLITKSAPQQGPPDKPQAWHSDFRNEKEEELGTPLYVIFSVPEQAFNCDTDIPTGPRRIGFRDLDNHEYHLLVPPGVSLAMQGGVIHCGLPVEQDNAVLVSYVVTNKDKLDQKNHDFDDINDILFEEFRNGICKK